MLAVSCVASTKTPNIVIEEMSLTLLSDVFVVCRIFALYEKVVKLLPYGDCRYRCESFPVRISSSFA